jgi:hypothetical protein
MSGGTLFALTGEGLALQRQIDKEAQRLFSDDPAEVAEATSALEALITAEAENRSALEAKADAWCWVIDGLRARAAAQKEHGKRLASLAKEAEQRADALQDRLVAALLRVRPDETSFTLPEHKLTSRRSTAVEVDPDLDLGDLPAGLYRMKIEPDKDAAKKRIQAAIAAATAGLEGEEAAIAAATAAVTAIPGISLVKRRSWAIG